MSESKHTPAPWIADFATYGGPTIRTPLVNAVGGYAIAHILRSPNQTDPQVTVANARLIAASPDLLEKLKAALPYVERVAATAPTEPSRIQKQREASKTAAEIRAAIAKATESES